MASNVSTGKNAKKTVQVSWSPAPPKKKKEDKPKNSIQKAIDRNKKLEDLINEM